MDRYRETLLEHEEIFDDMWGEETFEILSEDTSLAPEICGRLLIVDSMLHDSVYIEPFLEDPKFMSFVSEVEYARLKKRFTKMLRGDT